MLVTEAQNVETRLENQKGKKAAEAIMLGETAIVGKGEKVGPEHSLLVQESTKELIELAQQESEEDAPESSSLC